MSKKQPKLGAAIPELKEFILKYGCRLSDKPPFVLLGQYNSKKMGPVMGILGAANNEFHAYLLRKEFRKNGHCDIECTEYYSGKSTFSIEIYKQKLKEKIDEKRKLEEPEAEAD